MKKNSFILLVIVISISAVLVVGLALSKRKKTDPKIKNRIAKGLMTNKGHNLHTIKSNQWYSNIYTSFPTQPLFAIPLVYQLKPEGLAFSYPSITKTSDTIFASFKEDFTIGLDSVFNSPEITHIGDWDISVRMKTDNSGEINFTLAHGVPSTTIHMKAEKIGIKFAGAVKIFDVRGSPIDESSFESNSLVAQIDQNQYIFVLNKSTRINISNSTISFNSPIERIFIAVLPHKDIAPLFKESARAEIRNTHSEFTTNNELLQTHYYLETNGPDPLIALYPHQYDNNDSLTDKLGTYQTLRGTLNLYKTKTFTTTSPLLVPPLNFTPLMSPPSEIITQLKQDIGDYINSQKPAGVYFAGTWFGKGATLLQLADVYNLNKEKEALMDKIRPLFKESLKSFEYDQAKTSMIAKNPEFGNENLNDHHFHYGYYIRTAAVLYTFDRSLLDTFKGPINDLVADIATSKRQADPFPFLRNFDIYEGHSWADGFSNFGDGNNQESTSEAIHAWYSTYLWAKVVGDTNLEVYSLYLYNSEIRSALYYWFDSKNMYDVPYNHRIASLVWGGKIDYKTWFSDETNMKYGIQLLPITPASEYLKLIPSFQSYESHFIASGGSATKEWGDLYLVLQSYHQPAAAFSKKNTRFKSHDATPRSLFLHMLYANNQK